MNDVKQRVAHLTGTRDQPQAVPIAGRGQASLNRNACQRRVEIEDARHLRLRQFHDLPLVVLGGDFLASENEKEHQTYRRREQNEKEPA